jgi:hypothetical protein
VTLTPELAQETLDDGVETEGVGVLEEIAEGHVDDAVLGVLEEPQRVTLDVLVGVRFVGLPGPVRSIASIGAAIVVF